MTKRISDLTEVGINDLTSLQAAIVGIDNANDSPVTSRKLSVQQIHGTTYDLWPTGSAATDTVAFETLMKRIPTAGATVRIMDNANSLVLDPLYSSATATNGVFIYSGSGNIGKILVNKPFVLSGESPEVRVQLNNGYLINWGLTNSDVTSTSGTTVAAIPANTSLLSGWPAGLLSRGDWVLVWSDDAISSAKVAAHYSLYGGSQCPGEMHRIAYTYQANGVQHAVIDGSFVDAMSTNPRVLKIPMLRHCGIRNLTFGSQRDATSEADFESSSAALQAIDIRRTLGFRIENVTVDDTALGHIKINYSANATIEGYNGYAVPDNSLDYALVVCTVNGLTFRDSTWHNCRHVITTGGDAIGYDRFGTPLNVFVHNVTNYQGGSVNNDILSGFDTHAEGFNVIFDSCRVFAGGATTVNGFGGRARKTVFRNCSFYGTKRAGSRPDSFEFNRPAQAYVISGSDALIDGGYVYGAAVGVRLRSYNADESSNALYHHDCRVNNVTFDEVFGTLVYSENPINNLEVDGCCSKNCATHYATSYGSAPYEYPAHYRALLTILSGTGHKIRGNYFDRDSNDYLLNAGTNPASSYEIVGNHLRGYTARFSSGTNKIGIRADAGDPNGVATSSNSQTIQAAWSAVNYTS